MLLLGRCCLVFDVFDAEVALLFLARTDGGGFMNEWEVGDVADGLLFLEEPEGLLFLAVVEGLPFLVEAVGGGFRKERVVTVVWDSLLFLAEAVCLPVMVEAVKGGVIDGCFMEDETLDLE